MAIDIKIEEIDYWATVIVAAHRINNARLIAKDLDPDTGGDKTFDGKEIIKNGEITHYYATIPVLKDMDIGALQAQYPDTLQVYKHTEGWTEKEAINAHI